MTPEEIEIAFLATADGIEKRHTSEGPELAFDWVEGNYKRMFLSSFASVEERDEFYNRVMEARGK